jgi:predicted molibdopterin-dependent oxidoreductase YjgC
VLGRSQVSESKSQAKPLEISKRVVWEAYLRVKANKGAAGVDGQTIEQYEQDVKTICSSCGIGCRRDLIFRRR